MRNVILHMHLPKTGGSTLNSILSREFGQKHYALSFLRPINPTESPEPDICWNDLGRPGEVPGLEPVWEFGASDIFAMLDRNTDAVAVSRHGMTLDPAHLGAGGATDIRSKKYNIFPIFFLRRPELWHMSLYFQQRRDPEYLVRQSYDPRLIVAKTGTFKEYTQFCVDHAARLHYHKAMYNWTESAIDRMIRHIGMYQVGITERYDESLVVIESALAGHFSGIDMSYDSRVNVDKAREGNTELQNMAELERHLGVELTERFSASCQTAGRTYGAINAELDRRISTIPDFGERMDDFERRCQNGGR